MLLFSRFPLCSYSFIQLPPDLIVSCVTNGPSWSIKSQSNIVLATVITLYLYLYLSNLSFGLISPPCLAAQIATSSYKLSQQFDYINFSKYNRQVHVAPEANLLNKNRTCSYLLSDDLENGFSVRMSCCKACTLLSFIINKWKEITIWSNTM